MNNSFTIAPVYCVEETMKNSEIFVSNLRIEWNVMKRARKLISITPLLQRVVFIWLITSNRSHYSTFDNGRVNTALDRRKVFFFFFKFLTIFFQIFKWMNHFIINMRGILVLSLLCVTVATAKLTPMTVYTKMEKAHNEMPRSLSISPHLMPDLLPNNMQPNFLPDESYDPLLSGPNANQNLFELLLLEKTKENQKICQSTGMWCDHNGNPIFRDRYLCSCTEYGCICSVVRRVRDEELDAKLQRVNGVHSNFG